MNIRINIRKLRWINVLRIAGAYTAYVIGSGFATGQEIIYFFTSYGDRSYGAILLSAVLFSLTGAFVMSDGVELGDDNGNTGKVYGYYCGKTLGSFFNVFVPVLLFGSVVIMLSGSGATAEEYYGIDSGTGSLVMAAMIFISYALGFKSIVAIIGLFGPVIIIFSVIVGIVTCINTEPVFADFDISFFNVPAPAKSPLFSAVLYVSYNISTAAVFFRALGSTAESKTETRIGAFAGALLLMGAAFALNMAFLAEAEQLNGYTIPTLKLAEEISPVFGAAFSVILLIEIFSTAAPMMHCVLSRFAEEKTLKALVIGFVFITAAYLCSMMPFEKLISTVYPYEGRVGLVFLAGLFLSKLRQLMNAIKDVFYKKVCYNSYAKRKRCLGKRRYNAVCRR